MDNNGLWQTVLGELELTLSKANFTTWFKNTSIVSQEEGSVVISVPNVFTKEWLENKYNQQIRETIEKVIGPISRIEYKVGNPRQ